MEIVKYLFTLFILQAVFILKNVLLITAPPLLRHAQHGEEFGGSSLEAFIEP
jgi:hypothetical protein